MDAIADGLRTPGLLGKLESLEQRKAELELTIDGAPAPAPRIHPNVSELYRRKIETLRQALNSDDARAVATEILRGLVEAIHVRPADRGMEIELVGDIVKMLELPENWNSLRKGAPTSIPTKVR